MIHEILQHWRKNSGALRDSTSCIQREDSDSQMGGGIHLRHLGFQSLLSESSLLPSVAKRIAILAEKSYTDKEITDGTLFV
ncbi:MAG: hypothetical protein ABJA69_10290 [Acidobacteriaceae bacterium]